MNNKDKPTQCEAKICCKATAKLQEEVKEELEISDKSLASLLTGLEPTASGELHEDPDNR